MQDRPICFHCDTAVETNAEIIFEAPCGHPDHSSAVFHPLCLMEWREHYQNFMQRMREAHERWLAQHHSDHEIEQQQVREIEGGDS